MSLFKNLFGKRAETPGEESSGLAGALAKIIDRNEKEVGKLRPLVEAVNALGDALKKLSDEELKARAASLKKKFKDEVTARLAKLKDAKGEPLGWQELDTELTWSEDYARVRRETEKEVLGDLLPEAFALVREAGVRTIGLRHYDVQLIGGAVLHSGRIAEMRTGEGKTLVATLPCYLNALTGRGVHVITVNDYLAERDANWMRPIHEFLGMTVSFLTNEMENDARQEAYKSDILYATNSEVGFDYLRDNMSRTQQDMVQRPLNFAIVDEVDNILIDEARTPLIISAQVAKTERAMRRQAMATTCDGLARKLMPAVTEREAENLLDTVSVKNRVEIGALLAIIEKRGVFHEAIGYLIDSYLQGEKSARVENAGRLLDVAEELHSDGLISDAGRAGLEAIAVRAVRPQGLQQAWRTEVDHVLAPFATAQANAAVLGFDATRLAADMGLSPDVFAEEDENANTAKLVAIEIARRGLIDEIAVESLASVMTSLSAPAPGDAPEKAAASHAEKLRQVLADAMLEAPGGAHEAEALLLEAVPDTEALSVEQARGIVAALEQISLRDLLPVEMTEKLWEQVRLTQGRDGLRKELAAAITTQGGATAGKIAEFADAYNANRDAFLQAEAATLRGQLAGHENIAARAAKGESAAELARALQNELSKDGAFAVATKAVRQFVNDQKRAHEEIAEHLVEEMSQWVEVPREARKSIVALLGEGGTPEQARERVLMAVRDLPGENTELPALVGEAARQLQAWRAEAAESLGGSLIAAVNLPEGAAHAVREAVLDGEHSGAFEAFVGHQLLAAPAAAALAKSIEDWGARWDAFKAKQNVALMENIKSALELSGDSEESLAELLDKPLGEKLHDAVFKELARDAVARHLEPLLAEENATAFMDEIKRRLPLAKETANRLKPVDFANRSAEQLQRQTWRLVERSFQVTEFDQYKKMVMNLGWFADKDEKRRQASLTDLGTLIAERESSGPAFSDPDNFLDSLINTEILTEDEAALVRRAQAETPEQNVATITARVLRLPAERRRRLSEAKLQEVQSVMDQSVRAHALYHREVHYLIEHGEILIVDEFTGHKMRGRRFSEGLHEALEAKHGLEVQLESQTVATITIQNYFRLYSKLGGMTGTAKTEEQEFAKTYGIEVVSIPTNRAVSRTDFPDVVYKTAEAKFRAITLEILERHAAGQPLLVGTRSVEVSERTSDRIKAGPLQTLTLAHVVKWKMFEDKNLGGAQRDAMLNTLRLPVAQLPLAQVKNIAKALGCNPDPLAEENVDKLLSLFTVENPDRERVVSALRNGLPHNVLNAKNHRNEARIIAEAARVGAVTIATNMAGRGVDILLGGTLDGESRWRVITQQVLFRQLEGKGVHIRSRTQETTTKLEERFTPEQLQNLVWVLGVQAALEKLETSGRVIGQNAKEIRDALGQDLTTPDLKNKVRSRARRVGIVELLPLDADPLNDKEPLDALNASLQRLMGRSFAPQQLREILETGISTQATGRDFTEQLTLNAFGFPLRQNMEAIGRLIDTLVDLPDLDRQLLQQAKESGAQSAEQFDVLDIAQSMTNVLPAWVAARLKEMKITSAAMAAEKWASLSSDEVEINEIQILNAMGIDGIGCPWVRDLLAGWKITTNERGFAAPPEMHEILGDGAIVHYRLNPLAARKLQRQWQNDAHHRYAQAKVDAPNLLVLGQMGQMLGGDAPFLTPEWLHHSVTSLGLCTEDDIFQAQMTGQREDEFGQVHEAPVDVLIYRVTLERALLAMEPTLREAAQTVGNDAQKIHEHLEKTAAWATPLLVDEWIAERVATYDDAPLTGAAGAGVVIETGVAGQSADIVLESEPRPEDVAHTSEQETVKGIGGLHIIGTERHESRRIDNQLRGRAGRQGDPGSSKFYVSLEDELWRLFGVRGQFLLKNWDEDEPVEAKIISKSIERAQKKVELNHFESRKHVLQYDDVMNVQREVIYRERRRALLGGDLRETVLDMAQHAAASEAEKHCSREVRSEEWDAHKLFAELGRLYGPALLHKQLKARDLEAMHWVQRRVENHQGKDIYDLHLHDGRTLSEVVAAIYAEREKQVGAETMRSLERWHVLRSIDDRWMEHLAEMDYLRDAIWQEGYAQKDPVHVYRQEGHALFHKMLGEIRKEVTTQLFTTQFDAAPTLEYAGPDMHGMTEARFALELPQGEEEESDAGVPTMTRVATTTTSSPQPPTRPLPVPTRTAPSAPPPDPLYAKVGRNDPCPCGSGKKFKKCHGKSE